MGKILLVRILTLLLLLSALPGWCGMQTSRARTGIDQKVTELMIMAQKARDAGDMPNAELFWMHARELRPSLSRPAWLDQKPVFLPDPPPPSESELLARIASLPYEQAKILLEERLKKNPGDIGARRLYHELAQKNQDHVQVQRHAGLLSDKNPVSRSPLWYLTALVLGSLLVWQLIQLYRDLRH